MDAWAAGGEEGRSQLRKATCRCKRPLKRGYPNGETRLAERRDILNKEANPVK